MAPSMYFRKIYFLSAKGNSFIDIIFEMLEEKQNGCCRKIIFLLII